MHGTALLRSGRESGCWHAPLAYGVEGLLCPITRGIRAGPATAFRDVAASLPKSGVRSGGVDGLHGDDFGRLLVGLTAHYAAQAPGAVDRNKVDDEV